MATLAIHLLSVKPALIKGLRTKLLKLMYHHTVTKVIKVVTKVIIVKANLEMRSMHFAERSILLESVGLRTRWYVATVAGTILHTCVGSLTR